MTRPVRIALTKDVIDAEGNFIAPGPGLRLLDDTPGIEYEFLSDYHREIAPQQIEGYDMVCSLRPRWTAESLKGNDRLLSVHRFGVGYDMIDVPALTRAGVALFITPDAVRRPVATAILTFILALSTRLKLKDRIIRDGRWAEAPKHHGMGLVGRTLGVIGVGNIGHEVFRLAAPLQMRHLGYDPYIEPETVSDVGVQLVDLDTLLSESDFVCMCCPLNEETRHLIGESQLTKMKPTSFLINMARGSVVHEQALIRALREAWIQGAGLDVFEQEPIAPDNPLLTMDNVILAPHALAWTDQTFSVMWDVILKQIDHLRRGTAASLLVNPGVWDTARFQKKLRAFLEDTGGQSAH